MRIHILNDRRKGIQNCWVTINRFASLVQADGFPTLLFFPAGNKSFDPVCATLYFINNIQVLKRILKRCMINVLIHIRYY